MTFRLGVPVVVLLNSDGCAIARSAEAKALGIRMGDPTNHLRDKVRAHDSLELVAAARRAAKRAWREGYAYTKAGIMLDDLLPEEDCRRTLFEDDTGKRDWLMAASTRSTAASEPGRR